MPVSYTTTHNLISQYETIAPSQVNLILRPYSDSITKSTHNIMTTVVFFFAFLTAFIHGSSIGSERREDDVSVQSLQTLVQQQSALIQQQSAQLQALQTEVNTLKTRLDQTTAKVTSLDASHQKQGQNLNSQLHFYSIPSFRWNV